MRGPALGAVQVPTRVCPICSDTFFTQVGLDEHVRLGNHGCLSRRWVTGKISPAGLVSLRERGRRVAALNNTRRRRCSCGHESNAPGVGLHQKATGHTGWSEVLTA